MVSEQEALRRLREGQIQLPPLSLKPLAIQPPDRHGRQFDAIVRVEWRDRRYDFGVEYKSRSTPKAFQEAIFQALNANRPAGIYPMVMMPYLSPSQLQELESREVSGLDLCGNGIVIVPGEVLVQRSGAPNRFPSSAPIKNVYRKNSSIVARAFLLRPEYPTVNDILWVIRDIRRRSGYSTDHFAISTVSKVLKVLEEDLIVGRDRGTIRLLQPDKLLDTLVANYQPPVIKKRFYGRADRSPDFYIEVLCRITARNHWPFVVTGVGSTNRYSVMARGEMLSFYCTQVDEFRAAIEMEEMKEIEKFEVRDTFRFADFEVLETDEQSVYFDARPGSWPARDLYNPLYPWASPIQTYLELMAGDKRDQETAQQVRELILREIESKRS